MKSLLNRRSVLTGPSHVVRIPQNRAAMPPSPADADDAPPDLASTAGSDAAPNPGTEREPDAVSGAVSGSASSSMSATAQAAVARGAPRPVLTLRPVQAVPSQVSARGVQIANTAEVEWLAEEEALTPFRVFRSFAYSVSLLFHAKELVYYVALYQEGALWRALKAADLEAAEAAFRHFEDQATRLSDCETRRAQLEAQNEQLARMIARSEAEAERLRSDLQRRSAQEQAASNRQHQVRKEVSQLEAQRMAAQAHLNKAHRQMQQLNMTSNEAIPHLPAR
ncbi:DUF2968 domain-containing protein [Paraburkholderia phenoliruptrix]|uniref:DUF2968 domain-containing protein n=2 Tax=Paraburkholderia phenoliruptrix TaxID=252970 RepID=K0DWI1_9BURK|nr:DUF2968 domain-containing protein [Paraburkholderia phenoliruptrix]AFT89230.1 hypothetical protein BUPH_05856 [Paraburkholderia phenoliruptrix BR3459a]MDR6422114.1 prefoldin subunit 5 [Paraburkholderia phenoliruptrix]WMY10639.1 DUF2968 domain-containing protein [Paraburkholderia phenoliruptrix]CAB4050828.1 hypothetical protein LMG9964_04495 [Paraburkholderia phenoliruptrix]